MDPAAREVDLLGPPRADQPGQEPASAVIARQADIDEARREEGALGRQPDIAGQRDRHARAGRRAGQRRDRRLGEVVEPQGQRVLLVLEAADRVVGAAARRLCRSLVEGPAQAGHVAAGAEGGSRTRDDHGPHVGIGLHPEQRFAQRRSQRIAQRVALLRPVQRDRRNPVVDRAQQFVRAGVEHLCGHVLPPGVRRPARPHAASAATSSGGAKRGPCRSARAWHCVLERRGADLADPGEHAAGIHREAPAEDRADIGVGALRYHAFFAAAQGLDRLDMEEALLDRLRRPAVRRRAGNGGRSPATGVWGPPSGQS